jgi:hypothetical protein
MLISMRKKLHNLWLIRAAYALIIVATVGFAVDLFVRHMH